MSARGLIGAGIVFGIIGLAAMGWTITPFDAELPDFDLVLATPSLSHPFGTDDLGRDVLSRVIAGARVTVFVGTITVVATTLIGSLFGIAAACFGRTFDAAIMFITNVILSFPNILLALGMTAAFSPGLDVVVTSQVIVNMPLIVRTARGRALVVREMGYVEARRALGFSEFDVTIRTILPNSLPAIIVQSTLVFANSVIAESYLSFLGLGVQPPTPTWGNMLRSSIGFLDQAPWIAVFSGLAIFLTILGSNLLGDALHDHFQGTET